MHTILVTGATGNIGREIVHELARREGARVLVGSRNVEKGSEQFGSIANVRPVELNLDKPDGLPGILEGVDKVVQVSPFSPAMVQQTQALADAAKRAGIKHIVRSSLIGASEPSPIQEGIWHDGADRALKASGVPFTILKPNQYFQNFISPRNQQTVKAQGALYLPLGDARISNIDTRDLAAAAANVVFDESGEHLGKEYTLTGGEALTMHEVAQAIGEALGKPVKYVAVSEEQAGEGMSKAGLPQWLVQAILEWFGYCRAGRAERVYDDAKRLLGREPRTAQEFARDYRSSWE
jgi:uncharacterized protein YbjT (DUF2867 family)